MNKEHCIEKTTKYGSVIVKCSCLLSGKACNDKCKCKQCRNPNGASCILPSSPKRKRYKHDWQITVQKSADFLASTQELSSGSVTVLEYFVLEYIVQYCHKEKLTISVEIISLIYDAICTIVSCLDYNVPLGSKSEEQITSFMQKHDNNLKEFKKLSLFQLYDSVN